MDRLLEYKNKSFSQPVTPPRASSPSLSNDQSHSLPNSVLRRVPLFNIHLPSQELLQQETSEILAQQQNERGRPRSRTKPSTPRNRDSVTPRRTKSLTPRAESLTPRSKMSITPIRSRRSSRRRSSIVVTQEGVKLYKPDYEGPVTMDYLRFFCKALIRAEVRMKEQEMLMQQERIKKQELEDPFIENGLKQPSIKIEDLNTVSRENIDVHEEEDPEGMLSIENFNDSLQIPEDYEKLLKSPQEQAVTQENGILFEDTPENSHVSPKAERIVLEKPKPLSYLQKILLSKKQQSSLILDGLSHVNAKDEVAEEEVKLKQEVGVSETGLMNEAPAIERLIDQFTIKPDTKIDNTLFPSWTKNEQIERGNKNDVYVGDSRDFHPNHDVELKVESVVKDTTPDALVPAENAPLQVDLENRETVESEIDWDVPDFGSDVMDNDDIPLQEGPPVDEEQPSVNGEEDSTHTPELPKSPPLFEPQDSDVTPENLLANEEDAIDSHTPEVSTSHQPPSSDQVTPERSLISSELFVDDEIPHPANDDAIIQEDFVLDDDADSGDINESIFEGIINSDNDDDYYDDKKHQETNQEIIERIASQSSFQQLERMIPQKRKPSRDAPSVLDVNFRDVSYIVRSIQAHNFLEADLPPRKKLKKPKTYSKDIVISIQEKSNEFLDNLMDDLKSYAHHRGSNTIDMNDVLLYLQRTKFTGTKRRRKEIDGENEESGSQEIDQISVLAQKFLPLENLIALDNDLYDSVSLNK